jgi:HD-GYP domain-containing protein (c-di-GMP phosphodiesterase class II)
VGKVFIDPTLLRKTGALTPGEYQRMKLHPVLGHRFIKTVAPGLGHLGPQVAYQHHERQDGSGYPRGLCGGNVLGRPRSRMIHDFGSLAAVADVYDAMASDRPYRAAWPADQVLQLLAQSAGAHLNRAAVELALTVIAPYPFCLPVRVANGSYEGYEGIVAAIDKRALGRPRIRLLYDPSGQRIDPIEIDLAVERDVHIASVSGPDGHRLPRMPSESAPVLRASA